MLRLLWRPPADGKRVSVPWRDFDGDGETAALFGELCRRSVSLLDSDECRSSVACLLSGDETDNVVRARNVPPPLAADAAPGRSRFFFVTFFSDSSDIASEWSLQCEETRFQ